MMRKLTISALSAALMCTTVYAQDFRTEATQSPQVKTATTSYASRTQRNAGIPTVYIDIFDGQKTDGVLDSIGQDYKYDANGNVIYDTDKNGNIKYDAKGQPIKKTNGNMYNIYKPDGSTVTICNSYIAKNPELTANMREERWTNYYKQEWSTKDKNYDIARIQVIDASGGMKERDELVKLRGRGNSTWNTQKRAFRLKFPTKTALLAKGDGTNEYADAKSWTLIANAVDKSLIQNAIASEIGKKVGLPFNVAYKFVDLYINGNYWGCYQISDQIAVGGRRVNIDEKEGWLMESVATNNNFLSDPYINPYIPGLGNTTINIKNPEVEDDNANDPKITAISSWFTNVNFNDLSEESGYRKYVDVYSLADYVTVLDITGNYDGCISNYMYKDKGANEKLKFGPIWDNDISFGNYSDMENLLVCDSPKGWTPFSTLIKKVMGDAVFMKALMRKWNKIYPTMQSFISSKITEIASANYNAINDNFTKWPITQAALGYMGKTYTNYDDAIANINQFTAKHLPSVNSQYTSAYNALKTTSTVMIDASVSNSSTSPFSSVSNKICTTYVQNKSFAANTWTTICLPFNLDEDELKSYFGDDMQLAEYTRLDGAGTLMVFNKMDSPLLMAGVPYLIKPSKAVSNPTFTEVVLSIQTPKTVKISSSDAVGFTGTFYKTSIPTANVSTLQGTDFNKYTGGSLEGLSAYVSGSSVVSLRIEGEDLTPAIAMGDVNEDGQVSILDLTSMINYRLGSVPAVFNTTAADLNGDGEVTVLDVTMLINLILSQEKE